jgi:hypothetical protein
VLQELGKYYKIEDISDGRRKSKAMKDFEEV